MLVQKVKTVVKSDYKGPQISVLLQPEEETITLPRPKNSRQLLVMLGLAEETALVARTGHSNIMEHSSCAVDDEGTVYPELLTPDRRIWPGDKILVRKVGSTG